MRKLVKSLEFDAAADRDKVVKIIKPGRVRIAYLFGGVSASHPHPKQHDALFPQPPIRWVVIHVV